MQDQQETRARALDAAVRLLGPTLDQWRPVRATTVEKFEKFAEETTLGLAVKFEKYLSEGIVPKF